MVTGPSFVTAWGSLVVGAPALAWGLTACAVPVIVHLVLRPRPRRLIFPAVMLLARAQRSATRARRLRQWLLLLVRMLVIALMVAVLMKLGCAPDQRGFTVTQTGSPDEPVSAVICLEDSASMGYRFQGRSRLEHARRWAADLLREPGRFPPGSQIAVLVGSADRTPSAWAADVDAARRQLDLVRAHDHDRPVGDLLSQAFALLESAPHQRREVYLFNDLTMHSWRDVSSRLSEVASVIYVLDVGQVEARNAALVVPQTPVHLLPAGRPLSFGLVVRAGDEPVEPVLRVMVDGEPRDRLAVRRLEPRSEMDVSLTLPALEPGIHAMTITLEPADALDCDNRRYAVLSVGRPSSVLVLAGGPNHEVATLLTAMIAPSAMPAEQHQYAIHYVTTDQLVEGLPRDRPLAVFLADIDRLAPAQLDILAGYARAGGTLVVVPGPNAALEPYVGLAALLPTAVESIQTCPQPLRLAAEFSHPFLKPFADPATDSINDRLVFKRLVLADPAPEATMIAPFADQRPALLSRQVGQGRVVLLAFSPARDWGQFGSQAAPMIVLLHTMLAELTPAATDIGSFIAGQPVLRHTTELGYGPLLCRRSQDVSAQPLPISEGMVRLPTEQAGTYQILSGQTEQRPVFCCAVNVADAESDDRHMEHKEITARFPATTVEVIQQPDVLVRGGVAARGRRSFTVIVGLALLLLLLVESTLANRSYRPTAPLYSNS